MLDLVDEHPWNNFIQLKIHQVFEDYFDSENSAEQKLEMIQKSGVLAKLIKMSEIPEVTFETGNNIRNGHMGFVINLATKLKKVIQGEKLSALEGADVILTQEWEDFLNGEFQRSTDNNDKSLGGRTAQIADDDEDTNFEVNMDKIMQRFKCFNSVAVSNNSEDDDTNKEDTDAKDDNDDDTDTNTFSFDEGSSEDAKIEVVLPEQEEVQHTFSDAGFWKDESINGLEDVDIDDLLDGYE